MKKRNRKDTLVILTNIPTPYRVSLFNKLAERLRPEDIFFHVLFCAESEPNRHWVINVKDFNFSFTIMGGIHFSFKSFYPHFNPTVLFHLSRIKPKWLVIAGAWNTPTMVIASRKYGFKKTTTLFWSEGHEDAVRFKRGIIPKLRNKILSSFDGFVVPNFKSQQYISKSLGEHTKFVFLPNTVDDNFFQLGINKKEEYKKRIGIEDNKRVLVQVSQLEDRKGVQELIEAFLNLDDTIANKWVLVLVGEGSLKSQLEERAKKRNIIVTGHCNKEQVKEWLQCSDVFVLATKLDPNPLTPIEASLMRLPILLSSKAGNVSEIVREGLNGFTINKIEVEEIKAKLTQVLMLPQEVLKEMGEVSFKNASENFSQDRVVSNFIKQLKGFRKI